MKSVFCVVNPFGQSCNIIEKIKEVIKMIYLSKGIVQKSSTEQMLWITHCGQDYKLTGMESALWLNGRFEFATAKSAAAERAVRHLERMGLVEVESGNSPVDRYRILTRCICCPAAFTKPEMPMPYREKTVLQWLREAGIRLTVAELIFLQEHRIVPAPELLGSENRQALVETIYTQENIEDGILEQAMERAACRDTVVAALLRLLEKKKIIIL